MVPYRLTFYSKVHTNKKVEKYADFNRITESMRAFPGQPRFEAAAERKVIDDK